MRKATGPTPTFTYGDYYQWADGERWELLDGIPHLMSPAPGRAHQWAVGELFRQIAEFVAGGSCEVYVAPFDVRLPEGDETDSEITTVVQPDVSVVCDSSKLDDAGCRGAPDWIIEVRSPSSSVMDEVKKRDLYERHGVREYWIVRLDEGTVAVHRLGTNTRYGVATVTPLSGETEVAALPGLAIRWERVRQR